MHYKNVLFYIEVYIENERLLPNMPIVKVMKSLTEFFVGFLYFNFY